MKLTLTDKHPAAGDAVTYIFKPEAKLQWKGGQYLHYAIPADPETDDRGVERWFTIAAAPYEGHVQITTRISERHSTFKGHLDSLAIGDTIEADGPEGEFTAEPSRDMVLIAGGIGITPYRAMLLQMDHEGTEISARLLYANRDENFVFKDELEALRERHPNFSITYFSGDKRVDEEAIRAAVPSIMGPLFYISGPEPMVTSLAGVIKGMGVPEENVKLDDFPGYTWP